MRTGTCPKCDSTNVYVEHTKDGFLNVKLGSNSWFATKVDMFVCTHCGYYETYLTDSKDLQKISEKWERVTPPPAH